MPPLFRIKIFENARTVYEGDFSGPVEIGRQEEGEAGPYSCGAAPDKTRLVIAALTENRIARKQVRIEPQTDGSLLVKNLSEKVPIGLDDGRQLSAAGICVSGTASVRLGSKLLRIETAQPEESLNSLSEATISPGRLLQTAADLRIGSLAGLGESHDIEKLMRGLQLTTSVLQSGTDQKDLFAKTACAVVDLVGLDSGRILLWNGQCWTPQVIETSARMEAVPTAAASSSVLDMLRTEKKTFWKSGGELSTMQAASLRSVEAVVAAPILDSDGEVIGALYGDRRVAIRAGELVQISKMEAMLIELLACGVASGLARFREAEQALKLKTQFELFFGKELAEFLRLRPDLLDGMDADVTMLFCDIRGFSRVSESLGAAGVFEWMSEVMTLLSECVNRYQGIVIDYIGDELMAMWGAPQQRPDHARLACEAALDMLRRLPALSDKWLPRIKVPFTVGIGINSGPARVGNTGTAQKIKYGALGHNVNLASRVQGATKYLKSNILITGNTFDQLAGEFRCRRLCDVRVVNIHQPAALYELADGSDPRWPTLCEESEAALDEFERQDFRRAVERLGKILSSFPDDGPSILLLSRAVNAIVEGPTPHHPIWELPGK